MTDAKDLFELAEALEKGASTGPIDSQSEETAAVLPGFVREPLSRAEKLQSLTDTALDEAGEIMKLPLDRKDPSYGTTIRAQIGLGEHGIKHTTQGGRELVEGAGRV